METTTIFFTDKELLVYNRGVTLFGDNLRAKNDLITKIIKNNPRIDYLSVADVDNDEFVTDLLNDIIFDATAENLFIKYIIPPFSTLNTNTKEWRTRRELWNKYLGSSLVGRKEGLTYDNLRVRKDDNGTSQFDALLCELIFKWFGFAGCNVLDPFAGGHTRGAVANKLGYKYTGFDLSGDQIEANYARAKELGLENIKWIHADALELKNHLQGEPKFDLIMTCPPYGDLEKYTNDPRDLSNMEHTKFMEAYTDIITNAVGCLNDNRFAVFVVGDFRDKQGFYRNFVADTILAFAYSDVKLYNELILLNSAGTAPMRANGQFANRKCVKIHQNVLVFYKGDPRQIQQIYGQVDSSLPIPQTKQALLF